MALEAKLYLGLSCLAIEVEEVQEMHHIVFSGMGDRLI